MRIYHKCRIPAKELSEEIQSVVYQHRCEVCGQLWDVQYSGRNSTATRAFMPYPSLRMWRWQRQARKELK